MDQPSPSAAEHPRNHDRLNGWKEIASHFGKSVRTVQRWEKELRLPVHRIHTQNGEIVYAHVSELVSWQAANETTAREVTEGSVEPPPEAAGLSAATSRKTWLQRLALVASVAAISVLGWEMVQKVRGDRITDRQPAVFRVEDHRIVVLNAAGQFLWDHVLRAPQSANSFRDMLPEIQQRYMIIEDLDGDGKKEVLLSMRPPLPVPHEVMCFESDGTRRFTLRMPRTVMYGGEAYDPPFLDPAVVLVPETTGRKTLWIRWNHHLMFPSALQKVTSKGEPQGEFWVNGHIQHFMPAMSKGRRVMLLTAYNNEKWGVSLAAIDYENPSGSMPAESPKYRCDDCPAGQPRELIVFPRMEISRVKETRPMPSHIKLGSGESVTTSVDHLRVPIPGVRNGVDVASAIYGVDADWNLTTAEASDSYRHMHARLRENGLVNHEFGLRDERELLPVLRWDGRRFRPQMPKGRSVTKPTSPSIAMSATAQKRRSIP